MKKTAILITALVLIFTLSACGAIPGFDGGSKNASGYTAASPGSASVPQDAPMAPAGTVYESEMNYEFRDKDTVASYQSSASGAVLPQNTRASLSEKIIYTVYAEVETVEFDKSVEAVYNMLDAYGAFIENSYVSGRNYSQSYYGYQTFRNARFTLRVPKDALNAMTDSLKTLGNVVSTQSNAENITAQFIDTESRLKSYRTQEARLLALLEKAETVEEMIYIESTLTQVRYEIESMTSTLQNWQDRVDYSTVTISLGEVEKLTENVPVQRSYWERTMDGLSSTLRGVGNFFTGLLQWLIASSPVLVIIAVIVVVAVIIYRKRRRAARNRYPRPPHDNGV